MPSMRAKITRPIVGIMGRQLARAGTAGAIRQVYNRWSKILLHPSGVRTHITELAGRRCLLATAFETVQTKSLSTKALLYFHGGGYVFGTIEGYSAFVERLAKATGLSIYMPDYRLAPEHPYPAALDDGYAAYLGLLGQYNVQEIVVGGDSAGGALAIALMHRLVKNNQPLPTCVFVLSPWMDLSLSGESHRSNAASERVIPHPLPEITAGLYAGTTPRLNPEISPKFGNHKGLPPLLVQVSDNEILYDDAKSLVHDAARAGVTVTFETYQGLWHDWHLMAPLIPEATMAIESIARFIHNHSD